MACWWGNPTWLHFSTERWSLGTGLVLLLFPPAALAVLGPILRVRRLGKPLHDILSPILILAALSCFSVSNVPAAWVGSLMGICGTDMGTRAIRARLAGRAAQVAAPSHVFAGLMAVLSTAMSDEASPFLLMACGAVIMPSYVAGLLAAVAEQWQVQEAT